MSSTSLNTSGTKIPACPVCAGPLSVRLARGRKSQKSFLMLICAADGSHFRGFIGNRDFIERVVDGVEKKP